MSAWVDRGVLGAVVLCISVTVVAAGRHFGLGTVPSAEQIAAWDIDVRPDGQGLPPGQGTAEQGEALYQVQCASCHGEFGEARGRYPVLMGGRGTLTSEDPVKTVGSYWPYATTVFDYVRRAMPFGHAQSLTADETYAITAFVLNLSEIVAYDQVLDAASLAAIKMPNRDGFVPDDRPDVPTGEPCMSSCRGELKVVGKARVIDVTPEEEAAAAATEKLAMAAAGTGDGDPARGKQVFLQCSACHSLAEGEHRVGPSLHGIIGRNAGAADGFDRYSAAMKGSGVDWSEASLASYLKAPQTFVPGTNMPFPGITAEEDIRDLLAYLRQATR